MDIAETEKDEGAGMKEYIEREAISKAYMDLCLAKSKLAKSRKGSTFFQSDLLPETEPTTKELFRLVMAMPTADVAEVRHGRWIFEPGKIPYCSECKEYSDDGDKGATFCPWCGARMGEEDEHEAD